MKGGFRLQCLLKLANSCSLVGANAKTLNSSEAGRVLAIDFGSKRIGVALCDSARLVATPLCTIGRVGDRKVEHTEIGELVRANEVVLVVVGLPFGLDGGLGTSARSVLSEVKGLRRRLDVPVETQDERFSSVTAEQIMTHQGLKGAARKAVVDQIAAVIILQSWLERPK